MTDSIQRLIERDRDGSATPEETRALLLAALEDDEVADTLVTLAELDDALQLEPETASQQRRRWWPFQKPVLWVGATAATVVLAAIIPTFMMSTRENARPTRDSSDGLRGSTGQIVSSHPSGDATPAGATGRVRRPVFLYARLDIAPPGRVTRGAEPVYRSGNDERLVARADAMVQSVEEGFARVGLGAMDGVTRGMVLRFDPDAARGWREAQGTVTAVYREDADVEVTGEVREGQHVRVDATTHLRALSVQIDEGAHARNAALVHAAVNAATQALTSADAAADARRAVLVQLAALARGRGEAHAAVIYATKAVGLLDTAPLANRMERAEILDAAGTLAAAAGNLVGAEAWLRQAHALAPKATALEAQILNNRGAVAALRGDAAAAETFYRSALTGVGTTVGTHVTVIQNNLSQLMEPR